MITKRVRTIVAVTAAAGTLLAACGSDDDSASSDTSTAATTGTAGTTGGTAASESTASSAPGTGGTGGTGGTAGTEGAEPAACDDPYYVAVVAAFSGPFEAVGRSTSNGLTVARDQINASGGVAGCQLEFETFDDQGDPTKAVSILQEQLASRRHDAVIAGTTSPESLAMLPILAENEVLDCAATNNPLQNDPEAYPYSFRVPIPAAVQGALFAAMLAEQGHTKIAFLAPDDAFGQGILDAYGPSFDEQGLDVSTVRYKATDLDLSPLMQSVADADVDAIAATGTAATATAQLLAARALVGLEDVPFYSDASASMDFATVVPPEQLEGVSIYTYRVSAQRSGEENPPYLADFITALEEANGGPLTTTITQESNIHDCLRLFQVAAQQAGSTDTKAMAAALENLAPSPEGTFLVTAQYGFSAEDHFSENATKDDYALVGPIGPIEHGQYTVGAAS